VTGPGGPVEVPPIWRCATCVPEIREKPDRLGKQHEVQSAVPGSEGPGKVAPLGARLPPLARGWAEGAESLGEHQGRLRWVEPGRRSGATVATDPAGLSDTGTVEWFQPARAAVDWGRWREASNGGLYHWRLATFPFHIFGLLTHRWRCSESSLAEFLEKFCVKIWVGWCVGARILGDFFTTKGRRVRRVFCFDFWRAVRGSARVLVLTEIKRGLKKTSPPGPLSINGEGECGWAGFLASHHR